MVKLYKVIVFCAIKQIPATEPRASKLDERTEKRCLEERDLYPLRTNGSGISDSHCRPIRFRLPTHWLHSDYLFCFVLSDSSVPTHIGRQRESCVSPMACRNHSAAIRRGGFPAKPFHHFWIRCRPRSRNESRAGGARPVILRG